MSVSFPMGFNLIQKFCHTLVGDAIAFILMCVFIALVFVLTFCLCNPDGDSIFAHRKYRILLVPVDLLCVAGAVLLIISVSPDSNPRSHTAYAGGERASCSADWKHKPDYLHYYSDDYLTLDGTSIKIAKTHTDCNNQTITPLNSTGRAWMTVANKIQNMKCLKNNIDIDIRLAYTTGEVDTPSGTKKFICYADPKNAKPKKGYTLLTFDDFKA